MPIDYRKYPANWREISARIREREGNRCKFCGLAQYAVFRYDVDGNAVVWDSGRLRDGHPYEDTHGKSRGLAERLMADRDTFGYYLWRVCVLTVAHLHDPDPHNVADDNLAALCQRCHNRLDAPMRRENAARTRASKQAVTA